MNNQEALRIIKAMRQDPAVKTNCPKAHAPPDATEPQKHQTEKFLEQDLRHND